MQLRPE